MSTTDNKGLTKSLERDLMTNILNLMITAQKTVGWTGEKKLSFVLNKVRFLLGTSQYELYKDLVIEIIFTLKFISNNKELRDQLQKLSVNCSDIFGCLKK